MDNKLPNHAQDFEEYMLTDGSKIEIQPRETMENFLLRVARDAFITGYNTGYRHAKDDITA